MSETAPERTPAPPKGKGKKILGVDRTTAIVFGVTLVGAVAYFLWKRHSAATSATTQNTSSSAADYAGQLAAIQSELESLLGTGQQSSAVGSGSGGGSGGGGGYGYPYGGTTGPASSSVGTGSSAPASSAVGTGSSSTPASAGGCSTTPAPASAPPKTPAPSAPSAPAKMSPPTTPTGVTVSNVTPTSFVVHWAPDPHTSMYKVRVTYQGNLVRQVTVGPVASASVTGLTADHTYTVHVSAGNSGGFSSETNGPSQKTAK